eukprot:jgi/Tetstr1/420468/TSEL_011581.t1
MEAGTRTPPLPRTPPVPAAPLPWEEDRLQGAEVAVDVAARTDHRHSLEVYTDETLLLHFRDTCRWQKRLHEVAHQRFQLFADASAGCVVCLTTLAGIFTIILPLIDPDSAAIPIVTGTASILGGALGALARSFNLEVKSNEHNKYSAEYAEIARSINTERVLTECGHGTYVSKADFIKTVQARLNRLDAWAPSIPMWAQTQVGHPSARRNGD